MNQFAWGGPIQNSCKVVFRTTPVNIRIPFLIVRAPDPKIKKVTRPTVQGHAEMLKRLPKGNLRVESGLTKRAKIVDATFI